MSKSQYYRGWKIDYCPNQPVTGQWRASQYGVGMCAGNEEALRRMIDQKIQERSFLYRSTFGTLENQR